MSQLRGLRVLELSTGVAGPYAGRLLAILGATVVKAEPSGGDPCRVLPIDELPVRSPSPVFVHLNAGKRLVDAGCADLPAALAWADVVVHDGLPAELADLASQETLSVQVTPWGTPAPGARPDQELLVEAASGLLTAGALSDADILRFPGWQSQYLAGAYAAAMALAGLANRARTAEVSWVGAALSAVEVDAAAQLYAACGPDADDPAEYWRQAGSLGVIYPAGVFPCADGHVIPGTMRPTDWTTQCDVYGRPDLLTDPRFAGAGRWENRDQLRAELLPWFASRTREEIFSVAMDAGWAVGPVLAADDVLHDRHLSERGFLWPVTGEARAVTAGCPWRGPGQPNRRALRLAPEDGDRNWFSPRRPRSRNVPRPPAMNEVKVVELTFAWAGPFVGRMLGALGADVVRVETGRHPDGLRVRKRWSDLGVQPPDGAGHRAHTWDAAPQFNSLNRNKRAVSADLSSAAGADVFCDLVSAADVLVVNMNYRVLADRGVEDRVLDLVRHGLVVVNMPAFGTTGPYRAMPGYGMLTEGTGGFAARYGPPEEGARTSRTYYPDAVAGVHGVVAALAALAGRSVSGRGTVIDLSQQETLWTQLGEGLVLASRDGRRPGRTGNLEPGAAASGVLITADGAIAYVAHNRDAAAWLASVTGGDPAGWARPRDAGSVADALSLAGVPCRRVATAASLLSSGEGAARGLIEKVWHPVVGDRAYVSIPARIDGNPLVTTRPAPTFDEHTDEVLSQWLAMPAARREALRAAGAIGTCPPSHVRPFAGSAEKVPIIT